MLGGGTAGGRLFPWGVAGAEPDPACLCLSETTLIHLSILFVSDGLSSTFRVAITHVSYTDWNFNNLCAFSGIRAFQRGEDILSKHMILFKLFKFYIYSDICIWMWQYLKYEGDYILDKRTMMHEIRGRIEYSIIA